MKAVGNIYLEMGKLVSGNSVTITMFHDTDSKRYHRFITPYDDKARQELEKKGAETIEVKITVTSGKAKEKAKETGNQKLVTKLRKTLKK